MKLVTDQFPHGYALLIGVGHYPNVNPLPATVNDATVLYKLLTNPERAGYPAEQVKLLTDAEANRKAILDGLDWLAEQVQNDPEATAIIFFSGHGGERNGKEYILLPYDFKGNRWNSSSISKELFSKKIDAVRPKKMVIILDCCHAAGIATKNSQNNKFSPSNQALYHALDKGRGRVVVASSRADQYSRISQYSRYSVFTEALVKALDGEGVGKNNYATVLQVLAVVSSELKATMGGRQIPVFDLDKVEDFAICRINSDLYRKLPFNKTVEYLGEHYLAVARPEDAGYDLEGFKKELLNELDEKGFQAVADVLEMIAHSLLSYNKVAFANLRNDAVSNLAMLSSNNYIVQLKAFIGLLQLPSDL